VRLRAYENRVLRGMFGPNREELTEAGENCTMRGFITVLSTKYN
jgi:hypothetical protein